VRGWALKPLPVTLLVGTVAAEVVAVTLSAGLEPAYDTWLYALYSPVMAATGALIASRRPSNPIGWLFCVVGAVNAFGDLAQGWGLRAAEQGWPAGAAGDWIATWIWLVAGLGGVWTFLLFPGGRALSRRWALAGWAGTAGMVLAIAGWSLSSDRDGDFASGRNPLAVDGLPTAVLLVAGMTLFLGAFAAATVAVVVRFRRSRGVERQQMKWFALAAGAQLVILPATFALWYVWPVVGVFAALSLTALPVATGIAILRHGLLDIDLVINRTVVYGALSLLLAAAYVATSLLLGTALGRDSAWVTAAATLVAAAAFRPLRARVQAVVDRRFEPAKTHALRRVDAFLEELRGGHAMPEEIEPLLRDVLDDPQLELRFLLPASGRYADAFGVERADPAGDRRLQIPIEPLGLVLCDPARHENPAVVADVVAAGGLAIEIARLRVELRRQLKEVQDSRARIVAAGHDERRRIERDLHDGAQQRLVSIGLALRHAQHELGAAPRAVVDATLDDAVAQLTAVIEELRELAQGLPPSQLDAGLAAALHELAARAPLPVHVTALDERVAPGVEAAAYFIACEGLTNVVKHARATAVFVTARRVNSSLLVSVADDGVGGATPDAGSGLTGLADRVTAAGGTFRIESAVRTGTTLTAELPCAS
jgi:signal transduction histidine kinase